MGDFIGLDGDRLVETVDFLSEVEDFQLGLGAFLIQGGDFPLFILDDFLISKGLILEVGLGLLQFLFDEVEILL